MDYNWIARYSPIFKDGNYNTPNQIPNVWLNYSVFVIPLVSLIIFFYVRSGKKYTSDRSNEGKPLKKMKKPISRQEKDSFQYFNKKSPKRSLSESEQFASYFQNIEVFGHFESSLLADLYKRVELMKLKTNEVLFKPGDKDDSIFVVLSGKLTAYIEWEGTLYPVKIVGKGDSIFSLLSVLDVLTGHSAPVKTISTKADVESRILRLRATAFVEVFQTYPESWLRVVQMITLNLQHVVFDTLHSFLGLTKELLKPYLSKKNIEIISEHSEKGLTSYSDVNSTEKQRALKEKWLQLATAVYAKFLELKKEEEYLLHNIIEVLCYPHGHILCDQGSTDCSFFYVITGTVELLQKTIEEDENFVISKAHRGEYVGSLAILTGEPSFYTLRTSHPTRVAIIKKQQLYDLMKVKPAVVLKVGHSLVERLSPFVRQVDFALSWKMCKAGRTLYEQNDKADAIYLVLSGRLRATTSKDGQGNEIVNEFGRSDVVGMMDLYSQVRVRQTTVTSIRSTELAKLPEGLLNFIKHRYPQVLMRLVKLMINWTGKQNEDSIPGGKIHSLSVGNLNTLAVFAVSPSVPLIAFSLELWHALNSIKPTLRLSEDVVKKSLGSAALQRVNEYRLVSWLNLQEESFPLVVYQCNLTLSDWTIRCLNQADCILIVANGRHNTAASEVEIQLEKFAARAQKVLVLLWPGSTKHPFRTQDWLKSRPWVTSHYHVKVSKRTFWSKLTEEQFLRSYEKVFSQPANKFSDFSRLARLLTCSSIGLVLGGGGARGASHVGVVKALTEAGIPIDIVGGVSIGAFIGGIYCGHPNWKYLYVKARKWFMDMSSIWPQLFDLTYPHAALFTGTTFNKSLQDVFKDTQIEDMWIPYFTVTTDITSSEMRIHRQGALWRFCRASMSLAGYLPPITNPDDGHFLLDGGYVNNLPADVMRNMFGVATILAVDVGSQDRTDFTECGDSLSGWWVLWKKYAPFVERINILDLAEIQSRLAYVSCVRQLEVVKKAPYCYYIRPPIDMFGTLDFALFDNIFNIGYIHGKNCCDNWLKTGKLEEIFSSQITLREDENEYEKIQRQTTHHFTDLAALVAAPVPRVHYNIDDSVSVEDDVSVLNLPMQEKRDKSVNKVREIFKVAGKEQEPTSQDKEESNTENKSKTK